MSHGESFLSTPLASLRASGSGGDDGQLHFADEMGDIPSAQPYAPSDDSFSSGSGSAYEEDDDDALEVDFVPTLAMPEKKARGRPRKDSLRDEARMLAKEPGRGRGRAKKGKGKEKAVPDAEDDIFE
jgi:hypothetical protein